MKFIFSNNNNNSRLVKLDDGGGGGMARTERKWPSQRSLAGRLTRLLHAAPPVSSMPTYYVILLLVSLLFYSATLYGTRGASEPSSAPSLGPSSSAAHYRKSMLSKRRSHFSDEFLESLYGDESPPQVFSLHGLSPDELAESAVGDRGGVLSLAHSYSIGSRAADEEADSISISHQIRDDLSTAEMTERGQDKEKRKQENRDEFRSSSSLSGNPLLDVGRVSYTLSPSRVCQSPQSATRENRKPVPTPKEEYENEDDEKGNEVNSPSASDTSSKRPLFLLGFVHSAPTNFARRALIRSTWASVSQIGDFRVEFLFVVGHHRNESLPFPPPTPYSDPPAMTPSSRESSQLTPERVQQRLLLEAAQHGDIVQVDFTDSYSNLTYKHLAAYKWILEQCNATRYVVKLDDDAFIDPFRAVKFLAETFEPLNPYERPHSVLACSLFPAGSPTRRTGKWSLTRAEYPRDSYPDYCSGVAYFLTPDVMGRLLRAQASSSAPPIFIDDLYVTGLLAADLTPPLAKYPLNLRYAYSMKQVRRWLRESSASEAAGHKPARPSPFMVADIGSDAAHWSSLIRDLWQKTLSTWLPTTRSKR